MRTMAILRISALQLLRSPGKLIALVLLLGCCVIALRGGMQELEARKERIATIEADRSKEHEKVRAWFAEGRKGPEDMPWVDITDPFWCSWYARPKAYITPSPLLAIVPGRSADHPWFADLAYYSNAYNTRLQTEIADPEHRQLGTFDWAFVLIYLMPLFLLALVFDIGGAERDRGALVLIRLHSDGLRSWLARRFVPPVIAVWLVTILPMLAAGARAGALAEQPRALLIIALLATAYLLFWAAVLGLAAWMSRGSNDQALRGAIAYTAICLVIPGALQWGAKLQHPPSLMVDYITADRVGAQAVYELDADTIQRRFYAARPDLRSTPYGRDTVPNENIDWMMSSALVSQMMDSVVQEVAQADRERHKTIELASWWLPSMAIPLMMEEAAGTSAAHHLVFRMQVQDGGKRILDRIIDDSWNKRVMDAEAFKQYAAPLNPVPSNEQAL